MSDDPAEPRSVWPFDIGIVGTGIVGSHQLTREAIEVITRSNHTFVVASGFGVVDYLRTLCPKVTDLSELYEPGRSRLPTYERMAAAVVAAALEEPPVCFASYGHPWVYCLPTTLITKAAPLLGLHVEVFAGVSSLDTLLVDLGADIAFSGLQMYEATDLLLRRRPLQSDVACIVWQPTVSGDPTTPNQPYPSAQFEPLRDHLLRFYPADHEVKLVTTKNHPMLRSTVDAFPLGTLANVLEGAPGVGTLYLPPLVDRPVEDAELWQVMVSAGQGPGAPSSAGASPA